MSADPQTLREFADALDKDRGHSKSMLTRLIREAADEIEALRLADVLAEKAAQFLDTGRSDLDGALAAYRASRATRSRQKV